MSVKRCRTKSRLLIASSFPTVAACAFSCAPSALATALRGASSACSSGFSCAFPLSSELLEACSKLGVASGSFFAFTAGGSETGAGTGGGADLGADATGAGAGAGSGANAGAEAGAGVGAGAVRIPSMDIRLDAASITPPPIPPLLTLPLPAAAVAVGELADALSRSA